MSKRSTFWLLLALVIAGIILAITASSKSEYVVADLDRFGAAAEFLTITFSPVEGGEVKTITVNPYIRNEEWMEKGHHVVLTLNIVGDVIEIRSAE